MNPNIHQILKLTISLVLYGLLSGCAFVGILAVETASYAAAQVAGEALDAAVITAATKPRDNSHIEQERIIMNQ